MVETTHEIELKETHTQQVPQRRRRIHVDESELRETNPCVSLWFASILTSLALRCAFASIYLVVLFLCVKGLAIHLYSLAGTLHQVVLVLELEEGRNSDFVQVLRVTGLTGWLLCSVF